MTIEEFVEKVQDELQDTPAEKITAETNYKELDEWGSLTSLSLISMIEEEYDKAHEKIIALAVKWKQSAERERYVKEEAKEKAREELKAERKTKSKKGKKK